MKNKSKISLQELILRILAKKRACKQEDVTEQIEILLDENSGNNRKVKPKYVVNRTIKKMIQDEMISQHDTEQSSFLSLSSSGRQKLRNIKLSSQNHLISTTWDGYWRIVIIDIPESRKKDQDAIRYILKKAQFIQIKSSVWISPYPLEHMMINIKTDMKLEEEIMVLVTNKLDPMTEQILMEKFSTKKED